MSRVCKLTGKRPLKGNKVAHSNKKTNKHYMPNIVKKRIYVPELKRFVRLKLSARALKSITRKGLLPYLKKQGLTLKDVT
ncbi:MAG: 50S ribosomal protein L28 [Acidobacteria bacterium]|nr:MAG: 50S ribosomal protein L28 [Acidobacteriota bacterium]